MRRYYGIELNRIVEFCSVKRPAETELVPIAVTCHLRIGRSDRSVLLESALGKANINSDIFELRMQQYLVRTRQVHQMTACYLYSLEDLYKVTR